MRYAALAVAAAAMAAPAAPAMAQAGTDAGDVRCVMVLQTVSRDPNQRDQAARGIFYYLGRITARGPVARVESIMVAESKKMGTPQILQAELTRCAGELNQRGNELQAVNQRLQKQFGSPAAAPVKAPAKK